MTIKEEAIDRYHKTSNWWGGKFKPFNSRKRQAAAQIHKEMTRLSEVRDELLKLEKHETL
jgi:hypothetical protein